MLNGTRLSNRAGEILGGNYEIPLQGKMGLIMSTDITHNNETMVLGIKNDNNAAGTEVILEKVALNDYGQQWEIGWEEDTGYFTIRNPESEKFLTLVDKKLTIEGKYLM